MKLRQFLWSFNSIIVAGNCTKYEENSSYNHSLLTALAEM